MSDKITPNFLTDESGAVTVDWVVLSAAVIGVGMIVLVPIAFETDSSAVVISEYVSNAPVGYTGN